MPLPDPNTPTSPEELRLRNRQDVYPDAYSRSDGGQRLWHYTSNASMLAILDKKTLRATDIRYLNDATEFDYAIGALERRIAQREKSAGWNAQELAMLRRIPRAAGPHGLTFVFCMSSVRDDLAQWRGYTPEAGGVALGFETRRLRMYAQRAGFSLVQCIYDEAEQAAKLDEVIDRALLGYRMQQAASPHVVEAEIAAAHGAAEALVQIAPKLKHPKFNGEREWRLVKSVMPDHPRADVKTRVGKSTLVPFIELPIDENGLDEAFEPRLDQDRVELVKVLHWPITSVLCGPTPHPTLAAHAVAVAVRQHVGYNGGWNEARVDGRTTRALENSEIPYRPWV